jgi:hypothetical protein
MLEVANIDIQEKINAITLKSLIVFFYFKLINYEIQSSFIYEIILVIDLHELAL